MIELCAVVTSHSGGTPRHLVLLVSTQDGTGGTMFTFTYHFLVMFKSTKLILYICAWQILVFT